MEIKEHYSEILQVLSNLLVFIFDQLNENCKEELNAVNKQYPFEPLKYNKNTPVIDFKEARSMLSEAGEKLDEFGDFNTK